MLTAFLPFFSPFLPFPSLSLLLESSLQPPVPPSRPCSSSAGLPLRPCHWLRHFVRLRSPRFLREVPQNGASPLLPHRRPPKTVLTNSRTCAVRTGLPVPSPRTHRQFSPSPPPSLLSLSRPLFPCANDSGAADRRRAGSRRVQLRPQLACKSRLRRSSLHEPDDPVCPPPSISSSIHY